MKHINLINFLYKEYSRWFRLIRAKKIGKSDYNDIQCTLPDSMILKHGGIGVIIHSDAVIGDKVEIGPNVTIGGRHGGVPIIGDHVQIKNNAVIIGDVKVGHHSVIGAGAVVLKDVPPYSLAVGNPAKIIKGKYSHLDDYSIDLAKTNSISN